MWHVVETICPVAAILPPRVSIPDNPRLVGRYNLKLAQKRYDANETTTTYTLHKQPDSAGMHSEKHSSRTTERKFHPPRCGVAYLEQCIRHGVYRSSKTTTPAPRQDSNQKLSAKSTRVPNHHSACRNRAPVGLWPVFICKSMLTGRGSKMTTLVS